MHCLRRSLVAALFDLRNRIGIRGAGLLAARFGDDAGDRGFAAVCVSRVVARDFSQTGITVRRATALCWRYRDGFRIAAVVLD